MKKGPPLTAMGVSGGGGKREEGGRGMRREWSGSTHLLSGDISPLLSYPTTTTTTTTTATTTTAAATTTTTTTTTYYRSPPCQLQGFYHWPTSASLPPALMTPSSSHLDG